MPRKRGRPPTKLPAPCRSCGTPIFSLLPSDRRKYGLLCLDCLRNRRNTQAAFLRHQEPPEKSA